MDPDFNIEELMIIIQKIFDKYIFNFFNLISITYKIDISEILELCLYSKICKKCNIKKEFKEFYKREKSKDGYRLVCKECISYGKIIYKNTLNGALRTLIHSARGSAIKRKNKGRIDAGICDIILSDLEKLFKNQNGKCFYSNILMNYGLNNWQLSLERLDSNKGYEKNNIVLCCLEFNNKVQWSKEKIKEMISILNQPHQVIEINLDKQKSKIYKKTIKTNINGFDYYNCTHCNKVKLKNEFNKKIQNGCKRCIKILQKQYRNTPKGFLELLVDNAKKRKKMFDIDLCYLVKLYNNQRGLCAYSGLPLQFGSYLEKNWTCSLERIDIKKGYIKGNVCLICNEFNTIDNSSRHKIDNRSGGWNKKKFQFFLKNIV